MFPSTYHPESVQYVLKIYVSIIFLLQMLLIVLSLLCQCVVGQKNKCPPQIAPALASSCSCYSGGIDCTRLPEDFDFTIPHEYVNVTIKETKLKTLERTSFGRDLQHLKLEECSIDTIYSSTFSNLSSVKELQFIGGSISTIASQAFSHIRGDVKIVFKDEIVENISSGAFSSVSFTEVRFAGCQIASLGPNVFVDMTTERLAFPDTYTKHNYGAVHVLDQDPATVNITQLCSLCNTRQQMTFINTKECVIDVCSNMCHDTTVGQSHCVKDMKQHFTTPGGSPVTSPRTMTSRMTYSSTEYIDMTTPHSVANTRLADIYVFCIVLLSNVISK